MIRVSKRSKEKQVLSLSTPDKHSRKLFIAEDSESA